MFHSSRALKLSAAPWHSAAGQKIDKLNLALSTFFPPQITSVAISHQPSSARLRVLVATAKFIAICTNFADIEFQQLLLFT